MIRRLFTRAMLALSLSLISLAASADSLPTGGVGCPDSGILTGGGVVRDLCWTCFFPIRLGAVLGSPLNVPDDKYPSPVCECPGKLFGIPSIGLTSGMWQPLRIAESTRMPWCLPALGVNPGAVTGTLNIKQGGYRKNNDNAEGNSFKQFHYYAFPVGAVLDMIADAACSPSANADIDVLYFSELDPTWDDDELSIFTTPEAVLFANPVAVAACAADAVASSTYKPILAMPWCAGSQGSLYPYSGSTAIHNSAVRENALNVMRGTAMMHRRLLAKRTYGVGAVCSDHPSPMLPKQQYRPQIMYPLAEHLTNHWMGADTITSLTEFRTIPVIGEDWDTMLWTYQECCSTLY